MRLGRRPRARAAWSSPNRQASRRSRPIAEFAPTPAAVARLEKSIQSLTAAGFRITHQDMDVMRRLIQPWQTRAYAYYDLLGEIKYAAQFYSRALGALELYTAIIKDDGELVPDNDPASREMLDRIQDPGGGRSGLLESYGRLMFLAGECYLFVSRDRDTGLEQWEMLSTDELRIQSGTLIRYKAPSLLAEDYHEADDDDFEPIDDDSAVAYRLWQRHPRYSMWPDSTMQGVLDLCEELVLLTQAVRSRARSRIAGPGILFIDERIAPPAPQEAAPDEDPEEDPWLADIIEAAESPIQNEGAASASAPIITRVPVPDNARLQDLIYHLQLQDPTQLYPETGLRYETIKRIAIGLDMPPEILMGLQDSNHWTSWMIDEQTWKGHLQPKAQQLVNDLTFSYYQPSLMAAGVTDWQRRVIAYDATAVINHPDRGKDAIDLFDRRSIGKKALRKAKGFDESDAPTDMELAETIGVQVRDPSLAWDGIPSVKAGGLEPEPGVLISPQADGTIGTPVKGTPAADEPGPPPKGPPGPQDDDSAVVGAARLEAQASRVLGACDLAVLRAREAAGNRVKSLAKKDADALALVRDLPAAAAAAALGPERLRSLGGFTSEIDLVAAARPITEEAFRLYGVAPDVAELILRQLEQHAARTLYEEKPTRIPAQIAHYVVGLIAGA